MMHCSPRGVLILTCLLTAAIASAPLNARAREDEPGRGDALTGVGAVLCTVVYTPLKLAFAASGLVVGGMAWAWSLGNQRVARPIFRSALRGDYVVTPGHLRGERRLKFRGGY